MNQLHQQLVDALNEGSYEEAAQLIARISDLNVPCEHGISPLYHAIMRGDASLVRMMLQNGADPNFVASGDGAIIYADVPLDLAMGLRHLMDWDIFHPIVCLLEEFGATDPHEQIALNVDLTTLGKECKEWQSRNSDL